MNAPGDRNGKYHILAEINMIPFIDIALVLLIIFMVMTPFLIRSQITVNLPEAGQAEPETSDTETVRVQVDRQGGIFVNKQLVPPDDVVATLTRLLSSPKTQPLLIEADKDVSFQHVVVVLDAGRQIGAANMGIGVEPDRDAKSRPH
jgi:biopolymer transport protein ExbD